MTAEALSGELRESRIRLFASIRGLSEEQFRYRSDGDGWSIAAHLAHLLRVERVFVARGAAALHEDEPFCPSTAVSNDDDPGLAQHLAVPQIIHGMQAARRELEALLSHGNRALDRAIVHERIGRITVREIVKKMADHEREHEIAVGMLARQALSARPVTIPLTRRS